MNVSHGEEELVGAFGSGDEKGEVSVFKGHVSARRRSPIRIFRKRLLLKGQGDPSYEAEL